MARVKPSEQNKGFNSQSSDKLLLLLEYLASQPTPPRLQDISEGLGIPQPTVLRYMNTLVNHGYVYREEQTLRYTMTWRICRLSHQVTSHAGIRDIAALIIRELSRRFESGACTATRQEDTLIYLDVANYPANSLNSLQHIGKGAPMHTTASGKVLLAAMSDAQIERYAVKNGLERLTRKTIVTLPALLSELREIRSAGYALDDEECEEGIRCVSAPLYDYTDKPAAAVSVFGKTEILSDQYIAEEIIPALLDAARAISRRLGYGY